MAVETAADRLAFLNTDEFACYGTYSPVGGGASTVIPGIFDSSSETISLEGNVSAISRTPTFRCRVDDLTSGGKFNDQIVFTSAQLLAAGLDTDPAGTYKVKVVQPDGTGFVDLILEKQ